MQPTKPRAHSTQDRRRYAPETPYKRLCLRVVRDSLLATSNTGTPHRCKASRGLLASSFLSPLPLYRQDRFVFPSVKAYLLMNLPHIGRLAENDENDRVHLWS